MKHMKEMRDTSGDESPRVIEDACEIVGEIVGALANMVAQHCTRENETLRSDAISANADAIEILGRIGLLDITRERVGRAVTGRWTA